MIDYAFAAIARFWCRRITKSIYRFYDRYSAICQLPAVLFLASVPTRLLNPLEDTAVSLTLCGRGGGGFVPHRLEITTRPGALLRILQPYSPFFQQFKSNFCRLLGHLLQVFISVTSESTISPKGPVCIKQLFYIYFIQ